MAARRFLLAGRKVPGRPRVKHNNNSIDERFLVRQKVIKFTELQKNPMLEHDKDTDNWLRTLKKKQFAQTEILTGDA